MGARIQVTGVANVQGALVAEALAARPPGPELARVIDHVDAGVRVQDLARLLRPHRIITAIVHNDIHQFPEPGRAGRHLHGINVVGTLTLLTSTTPRGCSSTPRRPGSAEP